MKRLVVVISSLVLLTAFGTDVFAISDSDLITIRNGFDARRDGVLASQVSSPYPDFTSVWGKEDYALAALYQHNASPTQIASANQAIIDACLLEKSDPHYTSLSDETFHWDGNLFFRIYEFFNHNAADPNFRGRLTPEAEAAICDVFWNYTKWNSKVADTVTTVSKTWYIWGSENHGHMRYTTNYSAAAILKDVAPYNTYTYNDGKTALQHYNAWNAYFKEYLRERAKKGLLIEIASHTYSKYTLQGWYNFYDFAEDPNLSRIAGMALDLWWADWAQDQINGVRGGGKCRTYQDLDRYATDDSAYAMCWYYFGIGLASSGHPGVMCLATSSYRLPLVVMDLALDTSGRGTYEAKSRKPGLSLIPKPAGVPSDTYAADANYGGIYRYVYTTPSFVIGSLMLEKRALSDWTLISAQNRWEGAIFNIHPDARIIPQCKSSDSPDYRVTNNQYWSVQNKGTLIVQKLTNGTYSSDAGVMRVYFSKSPMRFNAVNEENGWVFVDAGQSYAAVRPASGTYSWDDPNWMKLGSQYAAVIIEVAESKDYANFTAFKTTVKALPLSVVGSVVTYTGLKDNGTFTFYTDYSQLPKINGVPINLKPSFTFDSPFVHEDWASGDVTIHKNSRMCHLNFNAANKDEYDLGHFKGDLNTDCFVDVQDVKIIADNWLGFDSWLGEIVPLPPYTDGPFTDSSTTVALWHMDSTYTGTDTYVRVADDDTTNSSRNHELMLGSARAGYSATTRPTLSSPGFNGTGACLLFDGTNDETIATAAWPGCDSVLVDVWIYPLFSANSYMIVDAGGTWSLSLETNKLHFTTLHADSSTDNYSWPSDITLNAWHHVQAIMTNQGRKQLTLDGVTNTILTSGPSIKVQTKEIMVGKKSAATWYFNGYIDEVRVASIDPAGYRVGTVNLRDWAIVAQDWLKCTDPANSACETGL